MWQDTHTNFWKEYRDQDYSYVDLAKDLVDLIHSHYINYPSGRYFRKGHEMRAESALVPRIAAEVEGILFRDSLIVIHKRTATTLPVSEHL